MTTQDDPAERKARHLAQAQELQTLAMALVRHTAAKAEQALDQPQPDPDDPAAHTPDHVLQFVRLARLVNHTMVLETRIASDDLLRKPAFRPATRAPSPGHLKDPRRSMLRHALHRAAASTPASDRARLRRELDDHLDAELAADPDQVQHPAELLVTIAQATDLPIDPKDISDELLGFEPPTPSQIETAASYRPPTHAI